MSFRTQDFKTQKASLRALANLANRSMKKPEVVYAARKITANLPPRDDEAELQAIFDAVRSGHPSVKGLERGFRYVSDPVNTDFFAAPFRILQQCAKGACAGDCDEHGALLASLCGSIGFNVGIRAWGPGREGSFDHVYCIVGFPKHSPKEWVALDTTEKQDLGWEPPGGHWMDARLEN